MHYLYRITDLLNNKVYIGQSNKETERWRQHKYFARQEAPVQYIHRAMKKYGVENFTYEVIATCRTQEDADEIEIQLITQYESRNKENGYNVAPGGDHAWNAGLPKERQPMYGKKQSAYQKQRVSETHAGIKLPPHTEGWKQKQKEWLTGRPVSEETKEKIARGNRGKNISLKTRDKMSLARLGKSKISADQKLEIFFLKKSGWSVKKISAKYNCSEPTIYNVLKQQ